MTAEQAKTALNLGTVHRSRVYTNSTRNGKEKATPTIGKYNRCSKMTSMMGTTLEVGDIVMKNQKIEKAKTGSFLRIHHPDKTRVTSKAVEPKTAGSKILDESLKS